MQREHMDGLDVFVTVCETAWEYMPYKETQRSIRAACRDGRQLHDRLANGIHLYLSKTAKIAPDDLHAALRGIAKRGARLESMAATFYANLPYEQQEQQL